MPNPLLHTPPSTQHRRVLALFATGGTIAGIAQDTQSHVQYQAAALPVTALLDAVPALQHLPAEIRAEQLLAKDSKDLDPEDWLRIAQAVDQALLEPDVAGVVITHGTDTLEETAWFLHRTLRPSRKPVVLVSAMRPATALGADGPQNLLDACCVALSQVTGVVCVAAGEVHRAETVQKLQPYRIPAFGSGECGPMAWVEEGRIAWPAYAAGAIHNSATATTIGATSNDTAGSLVSRGRYNGLLNPGLQTPPPAVAWITSHAGFDARLVQALQAAGFAGVVVAGTGNASLHHALETALDAVAASGMATAITSRCAQGHIVVPAPSRHRHWALPAAKARIELLMELWLRNATQHTAGPALAYNNC